MLGAVIGDIAGSRFEWKNRKCKDFTMFAPSCSITDDSVMTLAVAQALLDSEEEREEVKKTQILGIDYEDENSLNKFKQNFY